MRVDVRGAASPKKALEGLVLPLQLLASVRLCRLRDVTLPGLECQVEAALVRINASPAAIAAAGAALDSVAADSGEESQSSDSPTSSSRVSH